MKILLLDQEESTALNTNALMIDASSRKYTNMVSNTPHPTYEGLPPETE